MKASFASSACLLLLVSSFLFSQTDPTISLVHGWKFTPGDSVPFAEPGFLDSRWIPIRADTIWEQQGYPNLDGFAWYRLYVIFPSSMREKAFLKDSVRLFLGKINNFDQTFLNGTLIGINGKQYPSMNVADTMWLKADAGLWNYPRAYKLAADDPLIRWDRENIIAVRVFDAGGQGGLWSGGQYLRMARLTDYFRLSDVPHPFIFSDKGTVEKSWWFVNSFPDRKLNGNISITVTNTVNGRKIGEKQSRFSTSPGDSVQSFIRFPKTDQPGRVQVAVVFPESKDTFSISEEIPYILTPKPGTKPRINGPAIYGARTGHPLLFQIPATGERPLKYAAAGLPEGIQCDPTTGILSGTPMDEEEHIVKLTVSNKRGTATREFELLFGEQIALTPQMGWNSWNAWGLSVDQAKVIASARTFREKGLIDHGWSYINIDDGWEVKGDDPRPKRDSLGNIIVNEKFPDMKALGDSIHSLGLKFGIYSSPGPLTCGGYTASYQHEMKDARSYAQWGIDYLKYDWCSYDKIAKDTSRLELMKPYEVMRDALSQVGRDIFFSLCQYGMGNVWEWGALVGGNSWRTTGDITDTWESMRDIGFSQMNNAIYACPGHWNDPDMLVVGWVGWGPSLHPSNLTPDEQYAHISLWSMLSAPLLIGCDLTRLDDFTLNLLTNDEVLALDQDRLGKQAIPILKEDSIQVWVKDLYDGGKGIGVFNLSSAVKKYTLDLSKLGIKTPAHLRDLWRQKDLGKMKRYSTIIPSHGVVLVKCPR